MDESGVYTALQTIVQLVQLIAAPLIAYGAFILTDIRRQVRDIGERVEELGAEVAKINGRVIRAEQWQQSHEAFDQSQHARTTREIERLENIFRGRPEPRRR